MGRVLLIEDDPDLGDLTAELVEGHGHDVRLAASGRDALRLLDGDEAFDLALLDWTLPDLSAERVAERLHARGVPIVLSSAAEGLDALGRRCGARALLPKPYALEQLYRVIDQQLTRTEAHPPDGATPP